MPDYEFLQVNINADIEGELFSASGRQVLNEGWKLVEKDLQDKDDEKDNDDNNSAPLPETSEGEKGSCNDIQLLEKKTKAPASFSEATLLKAMNEVYRYVQDSEIKKIFKETDGIGTAATQATILKRTHRQRNVNQERQKSYFISVRKESHSRSSRKNYFAGFNCCMGNLL